MSITTERESVERGWRDRALDAALHAEALDGDSVDALLREIRRARPAAVTTMMWVDRGQALRFLHERCAGFRSLTAGQDGYRDGDYDAAARPYVGWYAAEWEGGEYEVALPPEWGEPGPAIFVGGEPCGLEGFVRALSDDAARPAGRCLVYAHGWESARDLDAEIGCVAWDDVVLPPDTMTRLQEAVEGFYRQRAAFADLGFPWRRGVLLIGPPGTGKTMICRAAAAALPELPFLYVRDLRERREADSVRAIFARARRLAPCILAFEDLDGFVDRQNRSVFLNELDGFKNNDGMLVIASTNHPGRIDEALLKRPSRFDRVFHIGVPELAERREFCRRVLARPAIRQRLAPSVNAEELAARVAEKSQGFTPAFLKEAFLSAVLAHAQAGYADLDGRFVDAVLAQVDELRAYLRRARDAAAMGELRTAGDRIGL